MDGGRAASGTGRAEASVEAAPGPGAPGLAAARLIELASESESGEVLFLARGEESLDGIARALGALAPELSVHRFPAWDCPPYDRAPPSREVMGTRMRTLAALGLPRREGRRDGCIVLTTAAAALQRTPPPEAAATELTLEAGATLPLDALRRFLLRTGYFFDERVDEPGEGAIRGQVIDIFPAGLPRPYRIAHDETGRITAINAYDPVSQRTNGEIAALSIGPASEVVSPEDAVTEGAQTEGDATEGAVTQGDGPTIDRPPGIEHRLAGHYPALGSLFDAMPSALLALEPGVEDCRALFAEQVADAYETRAGLPAEAAGGPPPTPPDALYLTEAEWRDAMAGRRAVELGDAGGTVPPFGAGARPNAAFADYVEQSLGRGMRVVLAAAIRRELSAMARPLKRRLDRAPEPAAGWAEAADAPDGSLLAIEAHLDGGFVTPDGRTAVIAAADLLGSRASRPGREGAADAALQLFELDFRRGDVVVHLDHGLGVLEGLDTVSADGAETEVVRLRYARDETLMVPVEEIGRLWRYGSEPDSVTLDRLDSPAWERRRADLARALDATARGLVELAEARAKARASRLEPPARKLDRFAARFPFVPTADQAAAIAATLADLARETPMDRLVAGDVGFGKTEVALRAAAAAALSGHQVALVAPTTVRARQHVETFRRRFAGFGVEMGHLSRAAGTAESRAVREGLASGEVHVAIGTHALLSDDIRFASLALVIIDEEQQFGAAQKARIRSLGDVHVLTMTATPIPRTLQSALAGLQEVSVIATAPVRRQPIRTVTRPFDRATVREALRREHARGGQSFVVCPQIADLEPVRERLEAMAPDLEVTVAHGRMPADEIDEAVVSFAAGRGDVLLATNIIGAGLDMPRANTIVVWRADRFGLSQLHQLRGRVGRGRLRGAAYLLTDPEEELPPATQERLEMLAALDRLGAGFAVAARDLDLRGAGDLLGEEQAGHVKLIGVTLYQHMLGRALARLRGEAQPDLQPEIRIGLQARIPADYVPEPEMRLALYARVARLGADERLAALAEEIEDRFGPPPPEVAALLDRARLERLCRRAGVVRLDGGPQGLALSFAEGRAERAAVRRAVGRARGALEWRGDRLVLAREMEAVRRRAREARDLLKRLVDTPRRKAKKAARSPRA